MKTKYRYILENKIPYLVNFKKEKKYEIIFKNTNMHAATVVDLENTHIECKIFKEDIEGYSTFVFDFPDWVF